jgi:hypothetical protein
MRVLFMGANCPALFFCSASVWCFVFCSASVLHSPVATFPRVSQLYSFALLRVCSQPFLIVPRANMSHGGICDVGD